MRDKSWTKAPPDCCFDGNCVQRAKHDVYGRRLCDEHATKVARDVAFLKGPAGLPRHLRLVAKMLDLGTLTLGDMLGLPRGESGHSMSGQRMFEAGVS